MRTSSPEPSRIALRQRRPVAGAADRLGARHVELRRRPSPRRWRGSAERVDRAAERRLLDRAGLREPLAEAAQQFLVEARQRRAAELVVDDQAHRIRADVDDAVRRRAGRAARSGLRSSGRSAIMAIPVSPGDHAGTRGERPVRHTPETRAQVRPQTDLRSTIGHSTLICGGRRGRRRAGRAAIRRRATPISKCGSSTVVSGGCRCWAISRSS